MKNSHIKKVALFLALVLVMASFAGCGKKGEEVATNGSPVTYNGDKIYPIQCDDTLDYWMGSSTMWNHKFENFGDTPLGKAIAEATGVKVNYIHAQTGQDKEQFQIMLASDELPDLVQYGWGSYPGGAEAAIKDGYIHQLNDIVDQWSPAFKARLESNETWNKGSRTDSGALYTYPMLMEEGILQIAYGPAVRADLFKKLNLEVPTTIEEWETVLKAFKADGVQFPFTGDINMLLQTFGPAYGTYPSWVLDGEKVVYGYTKPGMKDLLTTLNKWYKEGLIHPDFATLDSKTMHAKLLNGEGAVTMLWCGSGIGTLLNAEPDRSKFDLLGVQFPAAKKGENAEYSYMSGITMTGSGVGISNNCKNIELAARFLDYGFTEEGHNLYNFGIEGESYTWEDKDGEPYPTYTDLILNNPDGLSIGNAMGLYTRSCYNGIMVQDQRYMEQYYPTEQQKNAQLEWMKTNMGEHLVPPISVLPEETDADANTMANVKTYVDEMIIKFITGEASIDKFDEYLEQVDKFGLQESKKFRQAAYERYQNR